VRDGDDGSERTQAYPLVRVGYKWKENITFEAEAGLENIEDKRLTSSETTNSEYYSIGYRWDF
jgi:outer membrane receptor for ferrienterochelin and colicin